MSLSAIALAVWAALVTLSIDWMRRDELRRYPGKTKKGLWPATWTVVVGIPVAILVLGGRV